MLKRQPGLELIMERWKQMVKRKVKSSTFLYLISDGTNMSNLIGSERSKAGNKYDKLTLLPSLHSYLLIHLPNCPCLPIYLVTYVFSQNPTCNF